MDNPFEKALIFIFITTLTLLLLITSIGSFLVPETNTAFHQMNPFSHLKNWLLEGENIFSFLEVFVIIVVLSSIFTALYSKFKKITEVHEDG